MIRLKRTTQNLCAKDSVADGQRFDADSDTDPTLNLGHVIDQFFF
jgi:hypothetical protein